MDRTMNSRTRLGAFLATATALAACTDTAMPGTQLGTFKISATPTSNTCGAAMAAPGTWSFDFELSREGDVLYWRQNDKLFSGPVGANNTAKIESGVTSQLVAPDAGVAGCMMTRADTITVTLPSSGEVTSVSGTISFAISMVDGSDCASQIAAYGGPYDAIPCTMDLTYTAARTKAP
jgi:hypothetical protein